MIYQVINTQTDSCCSYVTANTSSVWTVVRRPTTHSVLKAWRRHIAGNI